MAYLVTAMQITEKVNINLNLNLNPNPNGRTHSKVHRTESANLTSISSGTFGQNDRDAAGTHVAAREEEEEEEVQVRAARVAVHVAPATAQKANAASGVIMMMVVVGRGIFCRRLPIDVHVGEEHEDCMDCMDFPHGHARTVTVAVKMGLMSL